MTIDYFFDGCKFRDMGIYVSLCNGLLGKPNRKKPNVFEFPGESGNVPDLKNIKYDVRTIEMNCFIRANDTNDLIDTYSNFTSILLDVDSTKEFRVSVGSKSLSYYVYIAKISTLSKKFSDGVNVGTFTLTAIEPDTSIYENNE